MNLQNLYYVQEIIKQGSISAAARKLFISQAYLSKILMEVEKDYGIILFTREKNSLVLTERGAAFSLMLDKVLDTMTNFDQSLHQLGNAECLSFSSCPTAYVSEAYLTFIQSCEDHAMRINYHEGDNNSVINDVYTRASEFGFIIQTAEEFHSTEIMLTSMKLRHECLINFDLHLIARIGHPLARLSRPIQLEDIYNYDLVLYTQQYPTSSIQVETAQYEYSFNQIDWSRIRHITYVQSRAQYYDLIQRTNTLSFGFQPFRMQEAQRNIVSLQVDSSFLSALGKDTRSSLYYICPEAYVPTTFSTELLQILRDLDK